jgi:hypothetical protein
MSEKLKGLLSRQSAVTIAWSAAPPARESFGVACVSAEFKFTEALSFVINCDTQEEIDYYWEKLTAGGVSQVPRFKLGTTLHAVPSHANRPLA